MEAIDALKQKVLSLAIQGKLVAQDPTDEPASVLLDKIKAEKAELVKQGKIKKAKQESYIYKGDDNKYYEKIGSETKDITDEIPFDIPENWEWVRIKNLCLDVFHGRSPKYSKTPTECKIIGQQANQFYGIDLTYIKYGTLEFLSQITDKEYLKKYDVLLNTLGNGTVGRSGIYMPSTKEKILTDGHIFIFRNLNPTVSMYFHHYIRERKENIEKAADGTTNQTFLNLSKTIEWLVPLPPLSEQKRIVSEIEKIFGQIEIVKKNQEELNKLKDGLKNKILDLAIQGKLVEQDPNDEPASVLLEKIKAEKAELVKQGKIKKNKQESYIYKGADNRHYEKIGSEVRDITEEIPFDIPENWEWCRLGNICQLNPRNTAENNLEVGFIPMTLISDGFQNKHTFNVRKWSEIKQGFTHFANNDIGIAKITPCFENRKSVIFSNLPSGIGAGTTELHVIRPYNDVLPLYMLTICKTEYFITNGIKNFTGTAGQQRISSQFVKDLLIPLPPIQEQCLIVQKISKILEIINQL